MIINIIIYNDSNNDSKDDSNNNNNDIARYWVDAQSWLAGKPVLPPRPRPPRPKMPHHINKYYDY